MIQLVVFLYIMSIGWSVTRIGDFTVFDVMSVILLPVLGGIWQRQGSARTASPVMIRAALISGLLMLAATFISAIFATDLNQHFYRGIPIALALTLLVVNITLVYSTKILTPSQVTTALLVCTTVHSIVVILQGRFGMFLNLMGKDELQFWMRATGLSEHPIESGSMSGVGIVVALLHGFSSNKKTIAPYIYLVCGGICLYSMSFSASLTAFLTSIAVIVIVCIDQKKVGYIAVALPVVALFGLFISASEDNRLADRLTSLADSGSSYSTVEARQSQIEEAIAEIGPKAFLFGKGFDIRTSPQNLDIHNGIVGMDYYFGILGVASQVYLIACAFYCIIRQEWSLLKISGIGVFLLFLAAYLTGPTYSRRSQWGAVMIFASMPLVVRDRRRLAEKLGKTGASDMEGQTARA